ncbi:MarR family transcriptional regulator [Shimia sp. R11_0]|uniref:MarR family winged helix-turn-helix transcriptional regulator n=1 Tax=Shimia sp. R11_0 TaxID=2821096 RepID=UPI001ADB96F6|nr:MarR family transcriptional regulator [Shimia sp. R11_0]MBO9476430.1 MarR family transcriptional regulator [Shimia sp. R11_0]
MSSDAHSILDRMLCFEVYSTEHAFARLYKALLAPYGLTYPQFLVLVLLWEQCPQTVNGLGGQLGLQSSTLTPLLKRMEKAGLVVRTRDPEDERRVRVSVTAAGKALRANVHDIGRCVADATGMEEAELFDLMRSLRRLRSGLEQSVTSGTRLTD